MQNLEILDVFEILITQKTAKMPEGPFCQISAQLQLMHNIFGNLDLCWSTIKILIDAEIANF